jgi:hypothetical protein
VERQDVGKELRCVVIHREARGGVVVAVQASLLRCGNGGEGRVEREVWQ